MASRADRVAGKLFLLGLGTAVAALIFFAWLAGEVLEGQTLVFDNSVRSWVHLHSSPALTSAMRFFSAFGEPAGLVILGVGAVLLLEMLRWRRALMLFVITMAGAFVLDAVLKLGFHRTRPVSFFGTPEPSSYSFPSGHALFSLCFFGVLAAFAAARIRKRAARAAIWTVAVALIALIGYSRIYLGVHYPSDVLAGYAAAVVWVATVAWGDRLRQRRRRMREEAPKVHV